jgi:SAM-dependent methyltransferase
MTIFSDYARFYDLLYKDKNYEAEGAFVHGLFQKYAPQTRSILELGCGTGLHAKVLAEMGYAIHGIDQSEDMLRSASSRTADLAQCVSSLLSFSPGDIRSARLPGNFDAVISLFHVMSYQTGDDDLRQSFATARHHLRPGGIFIFDCWYGPAVLNQRPEVRVKRFEDEQLHVTRIAEPAMHEDVPVIDVRYRLFVRDKDGGAEKELHETHRMRYLFDEEISVLLEDQGMSYVDSFEWMTGREPGTDTWGVCFVAKA